MKEHTVFLKFIAGEPEDSHSFQGEVSDMLLKLARGVKEYKVTIREIIDVRDD